MRQSEQNTGFMAAIKGAYTHTFHKFMLYANEEDKGGGVILKFTYFYQTDGDLYLYEPYQRSTYGIIKLNILLVRRLISL